MAKTVAFDVDARQSLKRGIDIVAESVRITLGPKGRNVVLEKKFGAPTVTNDGVTIVREIELKDPGENTGAQLLREVATELAPPSVRRSLHAKVADALVSAAGGDPDWQLVATHYEQAENSGEAVSAYQRASADARRRVR